MTGVVATPSQDIENPEPIIAVLAATGSTLTIEQLQQATGQSQTDLCARIQHLQSRGVLVKARKDSGYRLASHVDPLHTTELLAQLDCHSRQQLMELVVRQQVDSTNSLLARYRDGATRACLAEQQTAGRGQRGKSWASPYGASLYLSVARSMVCTQALATLTLAVGAALAQRLATLGVKNIGLKWPNDLWVDGAKLGGILTETRLRHGMADVVVGLGLNISMPREQGRHIDQPWVCLRDHAMVARSRSFWSGQCLQAILEAMLQFENQGLAPFLASWQRFDMLQRQKVDCLRPDGSVETGFARGLMPDGRLRIDQADGVHYLQAGQVSLRLPEGT